ncbi:MAG: M23 family metallopeptidase [Austwickia sp.]|nr:M23 family metallopeptidase [Austwickia sp.]MBK8436992.1 M23 family metallopeptidase [Austwickia sp.]MBK9100619.1 M23 family metallopeptidase [Austwickia sp.]
MTWLWVVLAAGMVVPTLAAAPPGEPSPPPYRVSSADALPRTWAWPLRPRPAVVHPFDPPAQRWLAGHRGVDLSAQPGQAVFAPADATVAFAGSVAGRPVLSLAHEAGLRSTYEPVVAVLTPGSTVLAGDLIGYLSPVPGHCAPAGCLHWGVLRGRTYLDPLRLLARQSAVLLPIR